MSLSKMGLAILSVLLVTVLVSAQQIPTGGDRVILDEFGSWRMFSMIKPPEIAMDDGVKVVEYKDPESYWLNGESAPPATGWTEPAFNDGEWLRGPAGMQCHAPAVLRNCFRARFRVTDPAQVKDLKLRVRYHGGLVVYLNGQEVGRAHLPAGAKLAEAYPLETFVTAGGEALETHDRRAWGAKKNLDKESSRRVELRNRMLEVELPARQLRKGVNVLALEVVRSPYHKVVESQKTMSWNKEPVYNLPWNTCELISVQLTAGGVDGVEPNVGWAHGLRVWSSPVLRMDFAMDCGEGCEPVEAARITGTRNGIFSGKVVVGSARAIRDLKAVPGELKCAGGVIPASAVRVRYGVIGGAEYGVSESTFGGEGTASGIARPSGGNATGLGVLMDVAPAEYTVSKEGMRPGAAAPIWLTVKVPAQAKAGVYTGKVTVSAEGEKPVEVPLELSVADWVLPDPDNFQTWTEIIQSPDTLQLEYGVPAWSDKHFELIGRSFRLMSEVGSKAVYVPLICCTYYGNEESMVRWVKKGENDYDFDFSVMDRYLDAAQKNLGKPEVVCFIVWDVFMSRSSELSVGGSHEKTPEFIARLKERMSNPWVTTLEPATGKVDRVEFPDYFRDENNKKQWKRLFDALHERMKKRGLEEAMMLGWFSDVRAQKEEFVYWKEVSKDLPWVSHAHWTVARVAGSYFIKTGYNTSIHDVGRPVDAAKRRSYGWKKQPVIWAQNLLRPGFRGEVDMCPGSMWSSMAEITLAGGQRGFGRLGGDSWFVLKDKAGRRLGRVYDRYPWSEWPNLNLCCSLFAPGPEGAVATVRFEQMRKGIQECEARIFIEQALTDEMKRAQMGQDLVQRCQALLDERVLSALRGVASYDSATPWNWWFQSGVSGHAWFQSSGWQERGVRLYDLAAEVAHKLHAN